MLAERVAFSDYARGLRWHGLHDRDHALLIRSLHADGRARCCLRYGHVDVRARGRADVRGYVHGRGCDGCHLYVYVRVHAHDCAGAHGHECVGGCLPFTLPLVFIN